MAAEAKDVHVAVGDGMAMHCKDVPCRCPHLRDATYVWYPLISMVLPPTTGARPVCRLQPRPPRFRSEAGGRHPRGVHDDGESTGEA
jgi:hypothetical protein